MPRWTPEAREKQSQLIRQWQPWQHSTGPTTDQGKAISSQNARQLPVDFAELADAMRLLLQAQQEQISEIFSEISKTN